MPDSKISIKKRQDEFKVKVLENFRKIPVIQVACERAGISRATYYRWLDDEKFAQEATEALLEGEKFINDMGESQLINLIKDKNLPAINLWLKTHHPKYAAKVQVEGKIQTEQSLTPEQQELILKALKLSMMNSNGEQLNINHS